MKLKKVSALVLISLFVITLFAFLPSCSAKDNVKEGIKLSECYERLDISGHKCFHMTSVKTAESVTDYLVVNDGWLSKTVITTEKKPEDDEVDAIVVNVERVYLKDVSWNISRIKLGETSAKEVLELIGPPTKSFGSGIIRMAYIDGFDTYLLTFSDKTGTVVNIQHNGKEYTNGDLAIDQIITIVLSIAVGLTVAIILSIKLAKKRKKHQS